MKRTDKEDNLINSMIEEADAMFLKLLDDYPILDDDDHRQATLILSLVTNGIARLHVLGWTEKDLCNEVFDWCEQARSWNKESE
jgi:hypothetical protein